MEFAVALHIMSFERCTGTSRAKLETENRDSSEYSDRNCTTRNSPTNAPPTEETDLLWASGVFRTGRNPTPASATGRSLAFTVSPRPGGALFPLPDRLTQSTLAKAFHGELVPTEAELARQQSRPFEPADHLLARIRATA